MELKLEQYEHEKWQEFVKKRPEELVLMKIDLFLKSMQKAFDKLLTIRMEGLGTHMHGHSCAHLFRKTLALFDRSLKDLQYSEIGEMIADIFHREIKMIERYFKPIFEILTFEPAQICKREKYLLLRAFWDEFGEYLSKCSLSSLWIGELNGTFRSVNGFVELFKLLDETLPKEPKEHEKSEEHTEQLEDDIIF